MDAWQPGRGEYAMSELIDMNVKSLLELTGSDAPTPGGGSMSALAGAVGAQLGRMVYHLTENKKAWRELDSKVQAGLSLDYLALSELAGELEGLIDEDAAAYNSFMTALRLPKDTDEQIAARKQAMQEASILSMEIPLQIAVKGLSVLNHLGALARYGNINAMSDIGSAAHMAGTCVEGAILNVRINLPGIADEEKVSITLKRASDIMTEKRVLLAEILALVDGRMDYRL